MRRPRFAALFGAAALLAMTAPGATAPRPGGVPDWLTPEFAARADAAGPAGVPLPPEAVAAIPTSSLVFTGIRPGTLIVVLAGRQVDDGPCTASFVFQETATAEFDPSQPLYLGAAAHCVGPDDMVQAVTVAPGGDTPVLVTIGAVDDHNVAEDIALIRIDDDLRSWVSPSMAHWGGPKGVHPGGAGVVVTYTGHGLGVGPGGTPRAGWLERYGSLTYEIAGVTNGGDSGAPVTTYDGLAVGQNRGRAGFGELGEWEPQVNPEGPTIGRILALTGKALATCRLVAPWPLPGCPPVVEPRG